MHILGLLLLGLAIGLSGALVLPEEKDENRIWTSVWSGIAGAGLGWILFGLFYGGDTAASRWLRWLIAIVVAVSLVISMSRLAERNRRRSLFQ